MYSEAIPFSLSKQNRHSIFFFVSLLTLLAPTFIGCGTTTQKRATEQLLISDAVDQAVGKIDFSTIANQKVYLDTKYLRTVGGLGFVNADYIISSLRQQMTAARCLIQDEKTNADIIVEPRVGALGTDAHEVTYGVPQTSALTAAATALSSSPVPAVPEISFGRSDEQSGIAKIMVFAYERESRQPVWQSGVAKAESDSTNTWFLGAGPFQKGSIYEGFRFAGKKLEQPPPLPKFGPPEGNPLPIAGFPRWPHLDAPDQSDQSASNEVQHESNSAHPLSIGYASEFVFPPAAKELPERDKTDVANAKALTPKEAELTNSEVKQASHSE